MRRTRMVLWFSVFLLASFGARVDAAEEWIDLLPATDPSKHRVEGMWTKTSEGLATNAVTGSRILLPIKPVGEYDFKATFTRRTGRHSIGLFFVAGGKQAAYEVDAWGQHLAGIQDIKGQPLTSNPTRVTDQTLENGRK